LSYRNTAKQRKLLFDIFIQRLHTGEARQFTNTDKLDVPVLLLLIDKPEGLALIQALRERL
jgi:hypothetical protein